MQRGSDIQFLRGLARRNGKVCRVACADKPGVRTGYFATPNLAGNPAAALSLNDLTDWTVDSLDLSWDATLATAVQARQALFTDSDEDGVSGDASDSGLAASRRSRTCRLHPADDDRPAHHSRGQRRRTVAAGEFAAPRVRAGSCACEGEADVSRLGAVLRAGDIVSVDGIGALHSGNYLVWSVRHTITANGHKMKFAARPQCRRPGLERGGGRAGRIGRTTCGGGMNEQAIMDVLDRLTNRFYGIYRGTVTEVDPSTLRIKAKVPAVLLRQPTGWCEHCVPFAGNNMGMAFLPEVGAGVWIEFEGGDVSHPIWVGCYWRARETPADAAPSVKTIVTKAGHKVLLDDEAGTITISDPNQNTVTLSSDGITLMRGGNQIVISDAEVNINDGALEVI